MDEGQTKIAKGVISGIATFLLAEGTAYKINRMRQNAGLPHIHHYQIGGTILSAGALNSDNKLAPYAIGGGTGLIIHDAVDVIRDVARPFERIPKPFNHYDFRDSEVKTYKYKVSDTNLKARYNKIAEILGYWTQKQSSDPKVMAWARKVIREDPTITDARDPIQCGRALAYWINGYPNKKPKIKYVRDPLKRSFDNFQSATRTLKWGTADCDCMALLFGTGMHSVGHPNGYYLISQNPVKPQYYSHILPTIIIDDGRWIPCELTRKRPVGYMPNFVKRGRILVD